MDTNDNGIFIDPVVIDFSAKNSGYANIRLGWQADLYYSSFSYQLPLQGQGSTPGIGKYRKSYKTFQKAEEAATEQLKQRLEKIIKQEHQNKADKVIAQQILDNIKASKQLSLF